MRQPVTTRKVGRRERLRTPGRIKDSQGPARRRLQRDVDAPRRAEKESPWPEATASRWLGRSLLLIGLALLAVSSAIWLRSTVSIAPVSTAPALASPTAGEGIDVARVLKEAGPGIISIDGESATFAAGQGRDGTLPSVGKGAGFFIDEDGNAVTNYHVIASMNVFEVTLADGTTLPGELIGGDAESDLAVIRVRAESGRVRPLRLGSSASVQVGDRVMAVGDPYGFQRTVSTGIVSGLDRMIWTSRGRMMPSLIQVDASIGPGNSGGPLLNADGEAIGVVSTSISSGASFGFAIPVERLRRVVPDLIKTGRVRYSWLGVSGTSVPTSLVRSPDPAGRRGVMVQRIAVGGPAHLAGLRGPQSLRLVTVGGRSDIVVPEGGDTIVAVNGRAIASPCDLTELLMDQTRPGDSVKLDLVRDGKAWVATVVLGERPAADTRSDPTGTPDVAQDDW